MEISQYDVARYYIGNYFQWKEKNGTVYTDLINAASDTGEYFGLNSDVFPWHQDFEWMKPILRRTQDMTKEELSEYYQLTKKVGEPNLKFLVDTPASLHYLIKKGIDAFDLIERDMAIDIKTQPQLKDKIFKVL